MYAKILVAIDGSEHSNKILNHAIELAKKFGSEITLIHVYSVVVPTVPATSSFGPPTLDTPAAAAVAAKMTDNSKNLGHKILNEAERIVVDYGITVAKVLKEGDAVKEIVAEAESGGYDLIVLGHRGMSKLSELLLGAVSEGVGHKAPCPVLIVK